MLEVEPRLGEVSRDIPAPRPGFDHHFREVHGAHHAATGEVAAVVEVRKHRRFLELPVDAYACPRQVVAVLVEGNAHLPGRGAPLVFDNHMANSDLVSRRGEAGVRFGRDLSLDLNAPAHIPLDIWRAALLPLLELPATQRRQPSRGQQDDSALPAESREDERQSCDHQRPHGPPGSAPEGDRGQGKQPGERDNRERHLRRDGTRVQHCTASALR